MWWEDLPFCIYGYGFCEPEPPPPAPEEFGPIWPFKVSVEYGTWKWAMNIETLAKVFTSSFVGALTAGVILYLSWRRHFARKNGHNSFSASQIFDGYYERPGPLGDYDADPPQQQEYATGRQNMSIIELGCCSESWATSRRPTTTSRPLRRTRSRSRDRRTLPSSPSRIRLRRGTTTGSECQILYERDFSETDDRKINLWNPLSNFLSHVGGGPLEEDNLIVSAEHRKLILHQFARGKFNPCVIPSGLKLESILRMCSIPYDIIFDCDMTGPWITFGGARIVGTQNCVKFLQKTFSSNMKNFLSPIEKQVPAWFLNILLDFHLYWGVTIWRWLNDADKDVLPKNVNSTHLFGAVDDVIRAVMITNSQDSMGKVNGNDIIDAIRNDLIALEASLGSKNHFIGDSLTDVDCAAFSALSQLLWSTPGSPFEQLIRGYPNLVYYCINIRRLLWSDWDQLIGNKSNRSCNDSSDVKNNNNDAKMEQNNSSAEPVPNDTNDLFHGGTLNHEAPRRNRARKPTVKSVQLPSSEGSGQPVTPSPYY